MAECPKCGMPMDELSSMCIDCYPDDEVEVSRSDYSIEEKTMELKFIEGVLYQGIKSIKFSNGKALGIELNFVKVPHELIK